MSDPDEPARARRDDPVAAGTALLAANGFPRIPAALLMTLMLRESGEATAEELAEAAGVSAGAVSGAVRFLQQVHMIERHRLAGSRKWVYALPVRPWYIGSVRTELYATIARYAETSVTQLTGAPRERMAEMAGFFRFIEERMPQLLAEWTDGQAADRRGTAGPAN